jgi:uncharacterized membrane protein YcaP (DUF421 family)
MSGSSGMTLLDVFGATRQVAWWQELPRAVAIFVYGLLLLRLFGRRTFARWSAPDIIISVITGSCLGRALTGGAPLGGTMLAVLLLTALHWVLARACAHSNRFARLIEGRPVVIGEAGALLKPQMLRYNVSDTDCHEALRMRGIQEIAHTRRITLEPSGNITVLTA